MHTCLSVHIYQIDSKYVSVILFLKLNFSKPKISSQSKQTFINFALAQVLKSQTTTILASVTVKTAAAAAAAAATTTTTTTNFLL